MTVAWYDILGVWIGIFITLSILSFLWGDNPFYKFAEHLFVGVSVGYVIVQQYFNTVEPQLVARLASGQTVTVALYCVPLVLGMMLFARLVPNLGWLSHYGFAFVFGSIAGMGIPSLAGADLIAQLHATMVEAVYRRHTWYDQVGALYVLVGLCCALLYFYFSSEHRAVKRVARVGVWVLMVSFGAAFGLTVAGRISLAIGRAWYLLGLDRPPAVAAQIHAPAFTVLCLVAIAAVLAVRARRSRG